MTDETNPTDPLDPGEQGEADAPGEEPRTEPTETLGPQPPPRRRLLRSRDDRMIAGVAGGLARYFAVDPVIVRIGFALSVFFGGLGALAYMALVLFVPSGDDGQPVGEAPIESSRGLAIGAGIGLVVVALSWGLFDGDFLFGFGDGWFFFPPLFLLLLAAIVYLYLNRGERPAAAPGTRAPGGRGRSVLSIAAGIVLALFALSALGMVALASAWAGATGHGVAVGVAIVAIGLLLALSAFRGAGARWLIVPAVALAGPLAVVSAADISFGDGIGQREYAPSSIATLPEDGYELGIGQLSVDLRELDWGPDTVVDLDVDLGIGQAIIAVPEHVCVAADLDATAGELDFAGSESDGVDPVIDTPGGSPPRLDLSGEVDLGVFRVVNDDDADLDELEHGRHRFDDDSDELPSDDELSERMDVACAGGTSGTREAR